MTKEALRDKFKSLVARTKALEQAQKENGVQKSNGKQNVPSKSTAIDNQKKTTKETSAKVTAKTKGWKDKRIINASKLQLIEKETGVANDGKSVKPAEDVPVVVEEKEPEKANESHMPDVWPSDEALRKDKDPSSDDLPTNKIKIDWMYGFRGQDVLCNLNKLTNGELVYFTGRVVVIFDFVHHSQRHYCEHTEDIASLAVHFDGIVVASAQQERSASGLQWSCRIWRTDSLTTMYMLKCEGATDLAGPIYLVFSPMKNWLLALDDSKDHVLSLWDIKGQKLASISTSRNHVQSVACDKKNENIFVTIGHEHIVWWEYLPNLGEINAKALADHRGFLKARITLSLLYTRHNDLVTGDSNGTIYVWAKGGNGVTNYIKHAHESYVLSLCMFNNYLLTGDKRGQIRLWSFNKNLDNLGMIMLPQGEGGVRHMIVALYASDQPVLIIGTTSNSLLQLPLAFGDKVEHPFEGVQFGIGGLSIAISQGHFGYLSCVSQVSMCDSWFITAGHDGQICVFDAEKHQGVQKTMIKGHQFTCVQWIAGDSIVLGTVEGRCIILEQQDLNLVEALNKLLCGCSITSIFTFTGIDDQNIYIGALDGTLTILSKNLLEENVEESGELWSSTMIQTPIYGIDFMQGGTVGDKHYLWLSNKNSNVVAYEVSSLSVVDNREDVRNIKWSQQQCGFIPNISGAWMTPLMNVEKVTSGSINEEKGIVALGTEQGKVAVYKYPCLRTNAYCHSNSTSNPVASLLFLRSGGHLVSVAGYDCCITQWKVM